MLNDSKYPGGLHKIETYSSRLQIKRRPGVDKNLLKKPQVIAIGTF